MAAIALNSSPITVPNMVIDGELVVADQEELGQFYGDGDEDEAIAEHLSADFLGADMEECSGVAEGSDEVGRSI